MVIDSVSFPFFKKNLFWKKKKLVTPGPIRISQWKKISLPFSCNLQGQTSLWIRISGILNYINSFTLVSDHENGIRRLAAAISNYHLIRLVKQVRILEDTVSPVISWQRLRFGIPSRRGIGYWSPVMIETPSGWSRQVCTFDIIMPSTCRSQKPHQ